MENSSSPDANPIENLWHELKVADKQQLVCGILCFWYSNPYQMSEIPLTSEQSNLRNHQSARGSHWVLDGPSIQILTCITVHTYIHNYFCCTSITHLNVVHMYRCSHNTLYGSQYVVNELIIKVVMVVRATQKRANT